MDSFTSLQNISEPSQIISYLKVWNPSSIIQRVIAINNEFAVCSSLSSLHLFNWRKKKLTKSFSTKSEWIAYDKKSNLIISSSYPFLNFFSVTNLKFIFRYKIQEELSYNAWLAGSTLDLAAYIKNTVLYIYRRKNPNIEILQKKDMLLSVNCFLDEKKNLYYYDLNMNLVIENLLSREKRRVTLNFEKIGSRIILKFLNQDLIIIMMISHTKSVEDMYRFLIFNVNNQKMIYKIDKDFKWRYCCTVEEKVLINHNEKFLVIKKSPDSNYQLENIGLFERNEDDLPGIVLCYHEPTKSLLEVGGMLSIYKLNFKI